ncbi:MAG TPA: hypothetical protein V6D07_18755 [Trichocoleus sp.]
MPVVGGKTALDSEAIQDLVAAMLSQATYNDAAASLTLTYPSTPGAVGAAAIDGGNISVDPWRTALGLGDLAFLDSAPSSTSNILDISQNSSGLNATVPTLRLLPVGTATNIDLVIAPKGAGAILAQIPDGGASGGDKRGLRSVDLQMERSGASKVTGNYAALLAGINNGATGLYSAAIAGRDSNASGDRSGIFVGQNHTASGNGSAVVGGYGNTVAGTYSGVFEGSNNSVPAAKSGVFAGEYNTVNGDTNGIFASYGSTTSSAAAYGAIVGGSSNNVSAVSAGVFAGSSNTANANYAAVMGGLSNTASALYAVAAGGQSNAVSGQHSGSLGGKSNIVSGQYAGSLGGDTCTASGRNAATLGGELLIANAPYSLASGMQATARGLHGADVRAAGGFVSTGDAQRGIYIARCTTNGATPGTPVFNVSAPGTSNQLILPNYCSVSFRIQVTARRVDAVNLESASFEIVGLINRDYDATQITLLASAKTIIYRPNTNWDINVSANTTHGGLLITATGEAGKTIRWVCTIYTTEVGS